MVSYVLTQSDAEKVNASRAITHALPVAYQGDVFPMMITQIPAGDANTALVFGVVITGVFTFDVIATCGTGDPVTTPGYFGWPGYAL
jgi:hypothetical protein